MKTYSSYLARRTVHGLEGITDTDKINMLILIEHIDWHTGRQEFRHYRHMCNWLALYESETGRAEGSLSLALNLLEQMNMAETNSTHIQLITEGGEFNDELRNLQ